MAADLTKSLQHILEDLIFVAGIKNITVTTVAVDPPNQAGAGSFVNTVTVTGVAVGDAVIAVAPASLEATLAGGAAYVTAADTVKLTMHATAAVDGASRNWTFIVFDRT